MDACPEPVTYFHHTARGKHTNKYTYQGKKNNSASEVIEELCSNLLETDQFQQPSRNSDTKNRHVKSIDTLRTFFSFFPSTLCAYYKDTAIKLKRKQAVKPLLKRRRYFRQQLFWLWLGFLSQLW